jgi:hypothetical protein
VVSTAGVLGLLIALERLLAAATDFNEEVAQSTIGTEVAGLLHSLMDG